MSRWRCNSGYPGTQLEDLRFIPDGLEFEVPDDTPARELWLPLDQAARDAVARKKAETKKYSDAQIAEAKERGEKPPPARVFTTKQDLHAAEKPKKQEARPGKDETF